MNKELFFIYYASIVFATIVGLTRYRYLDVALRVILASLIVTLISELSCYIAYAFNRYSLRGTIYHVYGIIDATLLSAYFIYLIKPYRHRKYIIICVVVWLVAGIFNSIFLQPLRALNTNMLMLQSIVFITMSLYYIYSILKNDSTGSIFQYPHFWMSVIWLVFWSSSVFFWAFIKILYSNRWEHIQTAVCIQVIIAMLCYLGIGATLLFYPKKLKS